MAESRGAKGQFVPTRLRKGGKETKQLFTLGFPGNQRLLRPNALFILGLWAILITVVKK